MINWFLKGPNWTVDLLLEEDLEPIEAATRCFEKLLSQYSFYKTRELNFDLGIILELYHSKMTSELQHYVLLTSHVLANSGLYFQAGQLDEFMSKLNN